MTTISHDTTDGIDDGPGRRVVYLDRDADAVDKVTLRTGVVVPDQPSAADSDLIAVTDEVFPEPRLVPANSIIPAEPGEAGHRHAAERPPSNPLRSWGHVGRHRRHNEQRSPVPGDRES